MPSIEFARAAVEDLDALIHTHSLPGDTRARVSRAMRPLERFPRMGRQLAGRWDGCRFVLGPWRWMLLVYVYFEDEQRIVVVAVEDGRTAGSPTARKR